LNEELKGHEERNRVAAQKRFKVLTCLLWPQGTRSLAEKRYSMNPNTHWHTVQPITYC
jgi:hypothetical protein